MVFDNVILILPDFTFFEDIFINPAMVLNFYTAYNYVPSSLSCNMFIYKEFNGAIRLKVMLFSY